MLDRRYLHLFAVFGNRTAGDLDILFEQFVGDGAVAKRLALSSAWMSWRIRVLIDSEASASLPSRGMAVEKEEFELVDSLGGVGVFVRCHPADGRFVHADVFSHIPQDQRFQVGGTAFEKIMLKFQDGLHHLVDGSLTLVQRIDEPLGTFYLFQ